MQTIDEIFKEIEKNKNLDHTAYVFYNIGLIKLRNLYTKYKATTGKDALSEYVSDYINNTADYLKILYGKRDFKHYEDGDKEKSVAVANILSDLYQSMDDTGVIDLLIDSHNNLCENNGVNILKVNKDAVKNEFDIGVNSRSKLQLNELKNIFWLNKYIKYFDSLGKQDIYNNNFKGKNSFKKNELSYLLYMSEKKYEILKQIYINGLPSNDPRVEKTMCREYEGKYEDTFKSIFPNCKNDIFDEYDNVKIFEETKDALYDKKELLLTLLVIKQLADHEFNSLNPAIKIWGTSGEEENGRMVVGFEPAGYMLPATFHFSMKSYSDIMFCLRKKSLEIPKISPIKRIDRDSVFTTNVLVKPTEEQKSLINKEAKKNGPTQAIYKRVNEQIKGKAHSTAPTEIVALDYDGKER